MPAALQGQQSDSVTALEGILKDGTYAEPKLARAFDIYTAIANDLSGAWVGQGNVNDALKKANSDLASLSGK